MRTDEGAPLISCIMAVCNGEPYLGEAIDSILAQTHRPIELIVIDDGSTDGTAGVLARYGARVRTFSQPNAGPAAARNVGLREARGTFVAFLDADDVWMPDKLERQHARFVADPSLEMCVTMVQNFWAPELREEEDRFRNHRLAQPAPGYSTVALLARRSVFDRIGAFEEGWRHVHDTEWFARAAEARVPTALLPDVLVRRRLHPTNRSRLGAARSREEYLQLVARRLGSQRRPPADA